MFKLKAKKAEPIRKKTKIWKRIATKKQVGTFRLTTLPLK